jgi:hypothetical protein
MISYDSELVPVLHAPQLIMKLGLYCEESLGDFGLQLEILNLPTDLASIHQGRWVWAAGLFARRDFLNHFFPALGVHRDGEPGILISGRSENTLDALKLQLELLIPLRLWPHLYIVCQGQNKEATSLCLRLFDEVIQWARLAAASDWENDNG